MGLQADVLSDGETTRFYLYDSLMKQINITRKEWEKSCDPERPCLYPYPFHFSTGDLGYIENGRFHPMDLSGYDIAFDDSGYCVIDWIHSASAKELPAKQEILREIGAYLRNLNRQNWETAKDQFIYIFARSQNKPDSVPYHVRQAALAELVGNIVQIIPTPTFTNKID